MEQGFFVTEIKSMSKGKYEVSLEGGEPLVLYGKELSAYQIREQHMISAEIYRKIIDDTLSKRATKRAMHLLEKMDRSEKNLRDKLKENGYPQECIDSAIAYVKSFHYLDDVRYAQTYITYHMEHESKRVLKQKLMQKGIPSNIIDRELEACYEADEDELIRQLLAKKHYCSETADMKEKQRIYAFLMRKGFSASAISSAMRMNS